MERVCGGQSVLGIYMNTQWVNKGSISCGKLPVYGDHMKILDWEVCIWKRCCHKINKKLNGKQTSSITFQFPNQISSFQVQASYFCRIITFLNLNPFLSFRGQIGDLSDFNVVSKDFIKVTYVGFLHTNFCISCELNHILPQQQVNNCLKYNAVKSSCSF